MKGATIWTEKYRPKTFDEIKGQNQIIDKIRAFVQNQNLPHIMLTGTAGTGKSTTAIVIARTLFGESWRNNFLELNASDERGIDVVRVKVKDFARTKAIGEVPFKIIFLDECDALTKDAQQALRRTMEKFTHTCRFILSCNYSSKIIDPIQSRCTIFRYKPLPKEELFKLIDNVKINENINIDQEAYEALYDISNGDARRINNLLQACSAVSNIINTELVFSMASVARPKEVHEVLELCQNKKFLEARKKMIDTKLKYGLSGDDFIRQVQKEIWKLNIEDKIKLEMIYECGETEFRLIEGSDEIIQLDSLLAKFVKLFI